MPAHDGSHLEFGAAPFGHPDLESQTALLHKLALRIGDLEERVVHLVRALEADGALAIATDELLHQRLKAVEKRLTIFFGPDWDSDE